MGIGNLQHVLDEYDGGQPVPYAQLYFDTAPDRHAAAFNMLAGFGDDSSLYYWRILGAAQIMRLYRSDRAALERLASLQTAPDSAAEVLHPPDATPAFAEPDALYDAYAEQAAGAAAVQRRARSAWPTRRRWAAGQERRREPGRCTAGCARPRSTC